MAELSPVPESVGADRLLTSEQASWALVGVALVSLLVLGWWNTLFWDNPMWYRLGLKKRTYKILIAESIAKAAHFWLLVGVVSVCAFLTRFCVSPQSLRIATILGSFYAALGMNGSKSRTLELDFGALLSDAVSTASFLLTIYGQLNASPVLGGGDLRMLKTLCIVSLCTFGGHWAIHAAYALWCSKRGLYANIGQQLVATENSITKWALENPHNATVQAIRTLSEWGMLKWFRFEERNPAYNRSVASRYFGGGLGQIQPIAVLAVLIYGQYVAYSICDLGAAVELTLCIAASMLTLLQVNDVIATPMVSQMRSEGLGASAIPDSMKLLKWVAALLEEAKIFDFEAHRGVSAKEFQKAIDAGREEISRRVDQLRRRGRPGDDLKAVHLNIGGIVLFSADYSSIQWRNAHDEEEAAMDAADAGSESGLCCALCRESVASKEGEGCC